VLTPVEKKRITEGYQAGQRLQAAARFDEAIEAYQRLLRHFPRVAEAHFQIARIRLMGRNFPEARASVEAALKLRPQEEALWLLLADIVREEGRQPRTAVLARARRAGLSEEVLGRIDRRFDLPPQRGAVRPAPEEARPFLQRAAEVAKEGDEATALRFINRAMKKSGDAPEVRIVRAETLLTLGDLDAAMEDAREVVKARPDVGSYWAVWARIRKVKADDPLLAELERRHEAAPAGSDDRRQMAYALAKAMEDIRADDRLFRYLNEGNVLTAKRYPYGAEIDEVSAQRVRETYSPALVKRWAGKGAQDLTPIFVTGLPRSGTTLTEQIISSHPMVTAGGETAILHKPMEELLVRIENEGLDAGEGYAAVGREYADEIRRRFPGKAIVTDKSISTYVHTGHVPLALPKAKIIVVRRDPRDSCLALLKQRFTDGLHRYSNSMEWTAGFYKLFAAQVAFWREAAPDSFIEVHYEDIVADLEGQARRMIEYCGLPWDEACLDFHKNERAVKTLSSAQVRQPLYSSSVGAWKRYEKDLKPLLDALGPIEDLP
jgi:tetratricopeptide (TPR) repeat protein